MDEATEGLTAINQWSVEFNSTSYSIAGSVTAAMLAVSLVFVVWALATNKDNARTYLITWFVALIFALLFILK